MSDYDDNLLFTCHHTHNNGFSLVKVDEQFLALYFFKEKKEKKTIAIPDAYRIELEPSSTMKDIKLEERDRKENNEMYKLFIIPNGSDICNIYYKAGSHEPKLFFTIEVQNFFK
ncbi:hypothetical protein F8M41_019362 [Gigaspora margarita]|uniref:Uncharacterized protein n=1 Tax=Gigaspora margarita TaxID=4874 RepID=A0A8H4EW21_GIGMA|nr:hypothetical protein F8M41_019362 [Gigaspora margarita]